MIQFYPSAEEALDHGFSEFVSPQFEWPILNNAPDGKWSGKWEYNRIQYEEMCTRVKQEVEIAVMDHGVPYASNKNTFNFPNGVYIDASDMETLVSRVQLCCITHHLFRPLPLPPISSVPFPFLPSLPSPSSRLYCPLPSVPHASLRRQHDLHQPGLSPPTRDHRDLQQH
ncbi:unnamed protein product [Closterium sp. NIES-64]|nr:unnamed protein product [Closterium sp. NIES-64]CAI5962699.1 unnamed protein product [Closterium sp. NIES-64]